MKEIPHLAQNLQRNMMKLSTFDLLNTSAVIIRLSLEKWTEVIRSSQSIVLRHNVSIYGRDRDRFGRWRGRRKFNSNFRRSFLTARSLIWGSHRTMWWETCLVAAEVFGHLTGGEPVVGVWCVRPLSSVHPAGLWRGTLPHLSLMDLKVKKKLTYDMIISNVWSVKC